MKGVSLNLLNIIINKSLREVIGYTFGTTFEALGAAGFPRLHLALDLVALAFRTCRK